MKNQKGAISLAIPIIIAVILIVVVALGYFWYLPKQKNENENRTGNNITSINDIWNKYTNYDLGFSLKVPRQTWFDYGNCVSTDGLSFHPEAASVPIIVLTDIDNKTVSIEPEYLYDFDDKMTNCTKVKNTLDAHPKMNISWNIKIATVNNDQDLNNFIRNNFGTGGCSLMGKQASHTQSGVYYAFIKSDGLDSDISKCFINYQPVIKYWPAGRLVATWNMTSSIIFWAVEPLEIIQNQNDFYDDDMKDSFKFL